MIEIVADFLPAAVHAQLQQTARAQRGKQAVFGGLQDHPFTRPIREAAVARFAAVAGLALQQVLLRFEAKTGLLHHDHNHRPDRLQSLVYYIDEPHKGGEIVFPYFDPWGDPVWNPVTEACDALHEQGQFFTHDERLEAYIQSHRDALLLVPPRANSAVLFRCSAPELWHYVCPVESGERAAVVLFYQAA